MVFPPLWRVFTVHESCHQVKSTLLDDIQKIMQEGDSREKVASVVWKAKISCNFFLQILEAKIEDQGKDGKQVLGRTRMIFSFWMTCCKYQFRF